MRPKSDDAVLGGGKLEEMPAPGAAVLGTGKLYARLFDRFNTEAKACNEWYLRLELTPSVALVRKRNAMPTGDIKIKVWYAYELESGVRIIEQGYWQGYWAFAGYLKHDGSLFGHTAKYDPARCDSDFRPIVENALREAAL